MSALLVKGGRLVDPGGGVDDGVDLCLEGGKVVELGRNLARAGARIVDAKGAWVMPGFVDLRSIVRDEADVAAALRGGFTTLVASPESPTFRTAALTLLRAAALSRALDGEELGEVPPGVVCLSQGFRPLPKGGVLRRALQYSRPLGVLVMVHAEDRSLVGRGVLGEGPIATRLGLQGVPVAAESSVVARDLAILEETGGRLHVSHVTCARTVELLRDAKRRGLPVSADATPHHLTLDHRAAEGFALAARVWPPLRTPEDVQALRAGLGDGAIDAVAADHVRVDPLELEHAFEQCAPGCESFEVALPRVLAIGLSPRRVVEVMSFVPARLLSLELREPGGVGKLSLGSRADVVVVDPATRTVRATISQGQLAWERPA